MACQSAWGARCSRDTDEMTILATFGQWQLLANGEVDPRQASSTCALCSHQDNLVVLSRLPVAAFMHQVFVFN